MASTVEELRDLIRLLEERPEWRGEVRRLLLTDELLSLPELFRNLAEAQRRTEAATSQLAEAQRSAEERMGRLEEQVSRLVEAQQRAEERMGRLEEQVGRLEEQVSRLVEAQQRSEERMGRLEEQVSRLVEAQQRAEERLGRLEERTDRITDDLGELKGDALERRYRERAFAYFASLVRRTHVVVGDELVDLLAEAVAQGNLSEAEAEEVAQADVIVRGRHRVDGTQVYLVVEVSWGVGITDVERAARRAELLAKTGTSTLPVVAGRTITGEGADLSRVMKVYQMTDGRVISPDLA
jgi:TolA-binding protein